MRGSALPRCGRTQLGHGLDFTSDVGLNAVKILSDKGWGEGRKKTETIAERNECMLMRSTCLYFGCEKNFGSAACRLLYLYLP